MSERLEPGSIVDHRYRVDHRVGAGGMAEVYCAEDLQLGRKIALKVLYRRFAEDEEFVERFRREASSAAGLQHQNVVAVYDRGEYDGTYYIAMEYLDGKSLKRIIHDEAPMPPDRAIDLIEQVLRAARFAHKRGIIHRDLKPHNVIVDEEGRAKVTDFGIARAGASDMTQTGSIMGTAQYLSPEQAQGQPVSERSDIYSVGVMLFEMLTARLPFDGDSAVTIALKHVNEAPERPSTYNAGITPGLEAVVMRAMAKDPMQRFPDADAFVAALEAARRGDPMAAGVAPGEITQLVGPVPPRADQVAAAYDSAVYPAPLPPRPEGDGDSRWWMWLVGLIVALGAIAVVVVLASGGKTYSVPNVVGESLPVAEQTLRNAGFSSDETPMASNSEPTNTVIGQQPTTPAKLHKGDTVHLTVSSGPTEATVPNLQGAARSKAIKQLHDLGFVHIQINEQFDPTTTTNHVISVSNAGLPEATADYTVILTISKGPQRVSVPDETGKTQGNAVNDLNNVGLHNTIVPKTTSSQTPGTVISMSPKPGSLVVKGSVVTLTVAQAPPTVSVPDVENFSQARATSTLGAAGLNVAIVTVSVADQSQDGKVQTQDPSGGNTVKKGSTVTISIGNFTPPPPPTTATATTPAPTTPPATTPTPPAAGTP